MKNIKKIYDNIYLGKWEDHIVNIPSCSIDLIVTSPPYNISLGIDNKHKKDSYDGYEDNMPYSKYLAWMTKLFTECNRVLKRGGRLAINIADAANGSTPTHVDFTNILLSMHLGTCWDYKLYKDCYGFEQFEMITTIVWDKGQIGNAVSWGSFQSPSQPSFPTQFEFIIVVGKGTKKHQGNGDISVSKENFIRNSKALWKFPPESGMMQRYDHPAVFPEELPRRLIDQLTYVGDIILDPFSGSGTTCAVAKEMERHYIGFEMSEKYHAKSVERLSLIPTRSGNIPKWMK